MDEAEKKRLDPAAIQPAGDARTIWQYEYLDGGDGWKTRYSDDEPVMDEWRRNAVKFTAVPPAPVQAALDAVAYSAVGTFLFRGAAYVATSSDDPRGIKLYRPAVAAVQAAPVGASDEDIENIALVLGLTRIIGDNPAYEAKLIKLVRHFTPAATESASEAKAGEVGEAPYWAYTQDVVQKLAKFCFGGPDLETRISCGAAYIALTNALTAKDGLSIAAPAAKQEAGELPKLPEREAGTNGQDWYTADQMRNYGQHCVDNDRVSAAYAEADRQPAPAVTGSIGDDAFILHVRALADSIDWREVEWNYEAQEKFALAVATYVAARSPVAAAPCDRNAVLEEAANLLLSGSFMHNEAPDARLAREAAKAIRALKSSPTAATESAEPSAWEVRNATIYEIATLIERERFMTLAPADPCSEKVVRALRDNFSHLSVKVRRLATSSAAHDSGANMMRVNTPGQ